MQAPKCNVCGDSGLVTIYHRDFDGTNHTISMEIEDGFGHFRKQRFPGTLACHCRCDKGQEIRAKIDDETRRRIPNWDVVDTPKIPYSFKRSDERLIEDSFDDLDESGLTDQAKYFVANWRKGFLKTPEDA